MTDYFCFGRETVPEGRPQVKAWYYPVLASDEAMCEICGRIDKRENMHYLTEGDGVIVYVCQDAHPVGPAA